MLNGHIPGLTEATAGCTRSKTGLCKDCPLFVSMPFDVTNPVTGEFIKSGTVYDCADVWAMMGAWDAGRQSLGTHAAVNSLRNESAKQHDEFMLRVDHAAQARLPHADS